MLKFYALKHKIFNFFLIFFIYQTEVCFILQFKEVFTWELYAL